VKETANLFFDSIKLRKKTMTHTPEELDRIRAELKYFGGKVKKD